MSNVQLERLKAEEAAAEAQMLGNPTPEPQAPSGDIVEDIVAATDTLTEPTQEQLDAEVFMAETIVGPQDQGEPAEEVQEPQPQKAQRTNWKKRFTNYKASTDGTINGLRRELIDLKSTLANLMEENQRWRTSKQEVPGDLFEGQFSQDEIDTFGDDGMSIVKKATQVAIDSQVKPLKEELRKQETQRIKDLQTQAHNQKQIQYDEFLSNLGALVPEYAELNNNKDFLKWMTGKDTYGSQVRMDLFRKAEGVGDVTRVADFFTEYKSTLSAVPTKDTVPEAVKRHITPMGGGASATTTPKSSDPEYLRESDINKFYRDLMKGRYDGQAETIRVTEASIERAYAERRVLRGQ